MRKIKKLLLLLLVLFIGIFGNKQNTNFLERKNARIINNGEIWTDNTFNYNSYFYNSYDIVDVSENNLRFNIDNEFNRLFTLAVYNGNTLERIIFSSSVDRDYETDIYISSNESNYTLRFLVNDGTNYFLNYRFENIFTLSSVNYLKLELRFSDNFVDINKMSINQGNYPIEFEPYKQIGYTIERFEEETNLNNFENNYNPLISAVENINNTELVYWSYNGYTYNSETKSQRITISPIDNNGEQALISMSASNTTTASDGPAMTTSIVGINTILQAGYFDFLNWRDYFEDITFYIGDPFNEYLRFKVVDNTITSGLRIETDATGNNTLITYQMNENDILRNNRVYISQDIISRFKKTNISNIRLNYKPSIKTLSSTTKYFTIATDMLRTLNEEEETYYNAGYNSGLVDGEKSAFSFEWIKEGVRTAFTIFDMKLAGDITLGNIIFIPLVIGALVFIIKIALKGGGD